MRFTAPLFVLLPAFAAGQCMHQHTEHVFGSCLGAILVTCGSADSIIWSNGYSGVLNQNLPVGSYSYTAYEAGAVIDSGTWAVQQLEWSFIGVQMGPMGGGYAISGWAELPYCGTSAFNSPCCMPDPASTYIRLLQDGVTEITTSPCINCDMFPCSGTSFMFFDVPQGHTYQVRLHDLSCGVTVTDTNTFYVPLTTGIAEGPSTADAEDLISARDGILTVPTSGQAIGSIQFFDGVGRRVDPKQRTPGTFDLGSLAPGIYLVSVPTEGTPHTYRFIRE